jgi:hypothetical protein
MCRQGHSWPHCRLPQSDPLNIPEDLREDPDEAAFTAARGSGNALAASSMHGSGQVPLRPLPIKRRSSAEIMRAMPDKLRAHAEHAQVLADDALNSFVIINAALQRSSALSEYVRRPDVQKRMGTDFRVGMGFGLHTGCAPVLHSSQSLLMWLRRDRAAPSTKRGRKVIR